MRRLIALIPLGLVALAAAGGALGQEKPKVDMQQAAILWQANCGRCHNLRPADERSDKNWETIVLHMRLRANLTGQDARTILEFLKSSN